MLKQMLHQVLKQSASKAAAKSKQSQIQTLARRLSAFGFGGAASSISSGSVPREPRLGMDGGKP